MAVTKVVMPKLSEQMESGKIIKWIKKEGDRIQGGDILAEVETDKADVEMEAFGAGVLRKILVGAGGTVPVGSLIAVIAEETDDINPVVAQAGGGAAAAPTPPRSQEPARPAVVASAPAASAPAAPRMTAGAGSAQGAAASAPAAVPSSGGGRAKASPLARKIAAQSGVDLKLIQGSGPGGRIVRRDVEAAATAPAASAAPALRPVEIG